MKLNNVSMKQSLVYGSIIVPHETMLVSSLKIVSRETKNPILIVEWDFLSYHQNGLIS